MDAMRRLAPWLVGLFIIAQVFGVGPVMSEHTAHVAEIELVLSNRNASTESIPQGHHHPGDADGFVQHHELQDLTGALTSFVSSCEIAFINVAFTEYGPDAFADSDPIRLERPPKPLLSI